MPDAGNFDQDRNYRDWGDAFAALPLETPDAGSWQRVQARLPNARPRQRLPVWAGMAASLVLVTGIAWRIASQPESASTPAPSPAIAATPPPLAAAIAAHAPAIEAAPVVHRDKPPAAATSQNPVRTASGARVAKAKPSARPSAPDLEPLYAQSAQLETLLAMARDDRVASGTTVALSDTLDAQIATIDAALRSADLGDAQRAGLWHERVDALQQLVGIETSNRLYAARGQSFDAALVRID